MELRHLASFVTVAEELHFGRAARRLHIVQPAVSQRIKALENEFGLRLFDRTAGGVGLTAAGHRLLEQARVVLGAADQFAGLAEDLARRENMQAQLRIGTADGMTTRLEHILAALHDQAPTTQIVLESLPASERLARVADGQLDAAFIRMLRPISGLRAIPLWSDRLVAALPAEHPLAGESTLPFRRLSAIPLRLSKRESNRTFVDTVLRACGSAGFTPQIGGAFTTVQNTLALLGSGQPSWTVLYEEAATALPTRRVAFRRLTDPEVVVQTSLVVRELSPAVRQLVDTCRVDVPKDRDYSEVPLVRAVAG
ncbi:LysR family transcriptional regulator [Nocardia aurantiaca]|uniref:LysR family transcriptional regulator n=1 Tax=Nocardia aurantiaca TaxID=2675850 RepID=A0A6I3L3H9_9NOCA|nr:LysR substrate-binding domain-containing protein [Nocardia aurantiaca]MTE16387.1 LysR family transcriptional regulator [Nocardia aurantiaca]